MKVAPILVLASLYALAGASQGEYFPEYQKCVQNCLSDMHCVNVFEEIRIEGERIVRRSLAPNSKREVASSGAVSPAFDTSTVDFHQNSISPLFRVFWNCHDDCNYKCQQIITDLRKANHLPMVQFFGKWPFTRVLFTQELFSVLFSIGNFYVNFVSLPKLVQQYNKNCKDPNDTYHVLYRQFINFIIVSLFAWSFSTLFHTRDNAISETLDYYGAFALVLSNFHCIGVRYFELFKNPRNLRIWQAIMIIIYVSHCVRLKISWDYGYNTFVNSVFGVAAIVLWNAHAVNTYRKYKENYIYYNNSIQLLPFETKILSRLNVLSLSRAKIIPLLPIFFNFWLMMGMSFELMDFEPIFRLIDAHSIWHFFTMFPTILWFEWVIWEIELSKLGDVNKVS